MILDKLLNFSVLKWKVGMIMVLNSRVLVGLSEVMHTKHSAYRKYLHKFSAHQGSFPSTWRSEGRDAREGGE